MDYVMVKQGRNREGVGKESMDVSQRIGGGAYYASFSSSGRFFSLLYAAGETPMMLWNNLEK